MAIFSIYRYEIESKNDIQCRINFPEDIEKREFVSRSPYVFFDSLFGKAGSVIDGFGRIKTKAKNKNKLPEWEGHSAKIEQHYEDFIVFQLQDNKKLTIHDENWDANSVGDHPYSRVIIDNRPNSHLIILERKTSVFRDQKKPSQIIKQSIERLLSEYNFSFKLSPLIKKGDFWDGVDEIRHNFKDVVRKVQFDFKSDGAVEDDGTIPNQLMLLISRIADGGQLFMDIGDNTKLDSVRRDLSRMAELCREDGNYGLTVLFKDFGYYKYGQDLSAQYGMQDDVITEFIKMNRLPKEQGMFEESKINNPYETFKQWFDKVNKLFKDYDKKEPVVRQRKPRTRR